MKGKFKSRVDFYKYLFFLNPQKSITIYINICIFIISLHSSIDGMIKQEAILQQNISSIFISIGSLISLVWLGINEYQEVQSFAGDDKEINMKKKDYIVKGNHIIRFDQMKLRDVKTWEFTTRKCSGKEGEEVFYSPHLNKYLWTNELYGEEDRATTDRVREFIKNNRDIVTPFLQYKYYNSLRNGKYFFNEQKLCMSSDILQGENIRYHKGSYFDSFLTNEICMKALERQEDGVIIYDASNFFPCIHSKQDDNYYLDSITNSKMNNHIGVSTLAFTKDHSLIIRMQGIKTQQNNNRFVPTGTGSCNWSDLIEESFTQTIAYAMQRELLEENIRNRSKYSPKTIGTTKVLGFYRWIERGGKPEFVGITKLKCNLSEMITNTEELRDIESSEVEDKYLINQLEDLPNIIERIRKLDNLSIPLIMCLECLEQYYNEDIEGLREFLEIPLASE